jgi:alkylation response protein AidB-like acyl-CoA dehydrogenase
MDFRLDDEQLALRDAIGALCRRHFDLAAVAAREGERVDPASWRALADIGVLGMLLAADRGGAGGGAVEAAIAFEQLGTHLATGPLLWSTIAAPLLPDIAAGSLRATGTDPAWGAPFVIDHAAECDIVLVVRDDAIESFEVAALPEPLAGEALDPLTPTLAFDALPTGTPLGGPEDAKRLRFAGTVLAAAQLVGVAHGALDVASAYALERHQFGVPIGSFQAVKHLLADMYMRTGLARSATYAAAAILDDDGAGDITTAASAAKVLAGEAGVRNGRAAVQILGGMGFTWAMLPHYYLKRAWVLEETFGTSDAHALTLSAGLEADLAGPVTAWT